MEHQPDAPEIDTHAECARRDNDVDRWMRMQKRIWMHPTASFAGAASAKPDPHSLLVCIRHARVVVPRSENPPPAAAATTTTASSTIERLRYPLRAFFGDGENKRLDTPTPPPTAGGVADGGSSDTGTSGTTITTTNTNTTSAMGPAANAIHRFQAARLRLF
jgi:hypothetical protein